VGGVSSIGGDIMTDKYKSTKEWATDVQASHLELCAQLLNQVASHIRGGHFNTEWDSGKDWYFDTSDVHKNIFMVYDLMRNLMRDCFDATDEKKGGKFIVHDKMFKYEVDKK
jgi:hypothetical protein